MRSLESKFVALLQTLSTSKHIRQQVQEAEFSALFRFLPQQVDPARILWRISFQQGYLEHPANSH